MAINGNALLTANEAASYLRISLATLYRMEKKGSLVPFRTLGGHRRYTVAMLNQCLEQSREPRVASPSAQRQQAS